MMNLTKWQLKSVCLPVPAAFAGHFAMQSFDPCQVAADKLQGKGPFVTKYKCTSIVSGGLRE